MTSEEAKDYIREWCPYDRQDEIIKALSNSDKEAYRKGYKDGQEALAFHLELCKEEQEPCEDCISREYIINKCYDLDNNIVCDLCDIREAPSVQPKTEVLDKIRAEISCNIIEDDTTGNTPNRLRADWAAANKAHLIDIAIIDKYKAENTSDNE